MTAPYNSRSSRPGSENDPWGYGGRSPPAPVPYPQVPRASPSSAYQSPQRLHVSEQRGRNGADKDTGDEDRQGGDGEYDEDPPHISRRAPVKKKVPNSPRASALNARFPQSTPAISRVKQNDKDSESGLSDDDRHPTYDLVGENIKTAVLIDYFTRYVDHDAKVGTAQHPTDQSRTGVSIVANQALNAANIRDLILDSRDWDIETQSSDYRKSPYTYSKSNTARRRANAGPSAGRTTQIPLEDVVMVTTDPQAPTSTPQVSRK